nr:hypothetical protein [Tanacetum cinerariifolium]
MESQPKTTQTVSALKLPLLKTREYDLWSIRMKQYLTFTDPALWEVIVNGDSVTPVASASGGTEGHIPPKTAKQKLARKNELKAKSTLMLAIPYEHVLKFHACKDEKSLWEAIKHRFQKLISQLEIYGKVISLKDANLKLLRSLPSAWNNIALIMRNKSDLDTLSMDDLYNNLKVYESEIKVDSVSDSYESDGDNNQVNNRFKKSEGYHAVSAPFTGNYMPPRADLSFAGLNDSVFKSKVSKTTTSVSKIETNASKTSKDSLEKPKNVRSSAPLIEDWESDSEDENVFKPKEVKKTVKPRFEKIEFVNARNTIVETKTEKARKFSQSPRGNKRNWNGLMTQRLGDGFKFKKKACLVCGSFNHLIKDRDFHNNKMVENPVMYNKGKTSSPREVKPVWDNTARMNHQNKLTYPHPKRNFIPAAVLTKFGQVPINIAKQSSHREATSVSTDRDDQGIFDSGCSRHMTGNKSYLTDYQEIDGDFVAFGGNAKGGKINEKGKIRTGKLDFEDVYFVKELKFNLFSVSQMCDKKNSNLFTDTECVLFPDFKLLDESQVCLRREFSVARTPLQNGVAERTNRTLIEAAKTLLADSKLPTTFWAEAVNMACYV